MELLELLLLSELAVLFLFWEVWDWWELLRGTEPMLCVAASFTSSLWTTLLNSSDFIVPITKGSLLSTDFIIRLKLNPSAFKLTISMINIIMMKI